MTIGGRTAGKLPSGCEVLSIMGADPKLGALVSLVSLFSFPRGGAENSDKFQNCSENEFVMQKMEKGLVNTYKKIGVC